MYPVHNLKADHKEPFYFTEDNNSFIIKTFEMFYLRIFSFIVGLAPNRYYYMRFSVRS